MAMIFSSGAVRTALRTKAATDDADFSFGDTLVIDTAYWSQASLSIGHFLQTTEPSAGNRPGLDPAISTGDNGRVPAQVMAFDGVTIEYADFVPSTIGSTPGAAQSSLQNSYIVDGVPFDGDPASANGRFDIAINYSGDPAYASYFQAAAARWSQIITADIPDITLNNGTFVDDLLIDASVAYIDGPGSNGRNILGQAGPDLIRGASLLPIHGQMIFDSYDLSFMVGQGILDEVILHEMGHVLGIGSLWDYFGLRVGNASYYGFTGANALAEYRAMSGTQAASVPIEPGSVGGSSGVHWSESVFRNELMTPSTGPGNIMPISRLTIASLADLGYTVNLAAADTYSLPGVNHAPVVTIPSANVAASAGQVLAASSLFSVTDADNDVLTYFIYDATPNGGHFVVNGTTVADLTVVALSAYDLARTTFVAGPAGSSDDLAVLVYDGHVYSGNTSFSQFHVNVAGVNHAPVVTIPSANVSASAGQVLAASSLFSVTDADNDVLTYFIYDATVNGGHFVVNGATVADLTVVSLSAWDLARTTFVAGAAGSSDDLAVLAYDGHVYSGNTSLSRFHVNVAAANSAPVVTIPSANVSASAGQVLAASSLFSVTDADNDVLTFFIYDATANGSRFVVNGSTVAAQTVVALSAWDLARTTVVAGPLGSSDDLAVLVYDGHTYSGNTSFSHFRVNVVSNVVSPSGPALAIEGDNFVFAQGLREKVAMESGQGITEPPADHVTQTFGAGVVAPLDVGSEFGIPDAAMDPLGLFGLHAVEHFTF